MLWTIWLSLARIYNISAVAMTSVRCMAMKINEQGDKEMQLPVNNISGQTQRTQVTLSTFELNDGLGSKSREGRECAQGSVRWPVGEDFSVAGLTHLWFPLSRSKISRSTWNPQDLNTLWVERLNLEMLRDLRHVWRDCVLRNIYRRLR
jgi:hypothetical protein